MTTLEQNKHYAAVTETLEKALQKEPSETVKQLFKALRKQVGTFTFSVDFPHPDEQPVKKKGRKA